MTHRHHHPEMQPYIVALRLCLLIGSVDQTDWYV